MPEKLKKLDGQPAEEQKCSCEGIGITSAVRVDVLRHAGNVEGFIVYEVKDGKLFVKPK